MKPKQYNVIHTTYDESVATKHERRYQGAFLAFFFDPCIARSTRYLHIQMWLLRMFWRPQLLPTHGRLMHVFVTAPNADLTDSTLIMHTQVSVRVMEIEKFMNSKYMFKFVRSMEPSSRPALPVLVHINFHTNKLERMQGLNKFYLENDEAALQAMYPGLHPWTRYIWKVEVGMNYRPNAVFGQMRHSLLLGFVCGKTRHMLKYSKRWNYISNLLLLYFHEVSTEIVRSSCLCKFLCTCDFNTDKQLLVNKNYVAIVHDKAYALSWEDFLLQGWRTHMFDVKLFYGPLITASK